MAQGNIKNMVVRIDRETHQQFKKLCIDENTTIQEYVTKLLREELEKKGVKLNGK